MLKSMADAAPGGGLHTNGGGNNKPCEVRLPFDQQETVPTSSDDKECPEHDGYPGLGWAPGAAVGRADIGPVPIIDGQGYSGHGRE